MRFGGTGLGEFLQNAFGLACGGNFHHGMHRAGLSQEAPLRHRTQFGGQLRHFDFTLTRRADGGAARFLTIHPG